MSKTAKAPATKRRRRPPAARVLGAKGGESKPYTPYKAPDSALSIATVKLLYALSEGPIVGPVDGLRSIKLNGTPLLSPDGSENFPGTIWDFRPGTVDQEHIAGFPAIENEASQGLPVELKSDNAWTRAITDQQLSAVRVRLSWPQIWQVKTNGDQIGYRIDYAIDLSVNGGSYQTVLSATLDDKGTTEYERTHRIDLPEGFTSALVRVRRLTPNRNDSNFADLMRVKGLTEVIDKKLRYPNLAVGGLRFDAKQFQDTPKFAGLMRGRIVQVPTNYDPQTRTYTGNWNGTFKLAYTNNPVWIWRDLLLHRRYGLGRRITADMVDHWTLYEIGRYCDVMVPDGKGGLQPRMTTNVYIQDSIEGYALLSDLASVFRGSSCWNGSQVTMVADIPGNEDGYVFTRSNIIGEFEYVAAAFPDRHTRAKVAWDNPENEFKTQPAPVTNEELIGALGHRMLDISRFGCTVEGEAIRHGIWALKSEQYEEWSVSFTTGMEGRNVEPGQIICVADELFSGRPNGGRISAATKRVITLDIDAEVHQEDRLILNLPSGKSEGRIVKSVSGRLVTVMADYSELPEAECSWSVESADLAVMRFRVQTIDTQGPNQFKIAATQHEPLKYSAIDTGARIDPQPTSIIPPGVMVPPKGISLEARSVVSQGIAVTSMRITWESVPGAIAYNVEWRKDSGNWIRLPRTGGLGADVEGIYSGRYIARVSSVSAMDVTSIWGTSAEVVLAGKVGLPPAVSFLTTVSELFGIGIKWGFPPGAEDTQRTELWYGPANNLQAATKLADLAYPQADYRMQQLLAGAQFFFWARLVDRTGNVGPFYPVVNGVVGQASAQAGPILDLIAGQIGETELGKELLDRIDLIDGPAGLPGSVSNRLKELDDQLQGQIDAIADIADSAAYDPEKSYTAGQSVLFTDGILYQAKGDVPAGAAPPDATYWLNVGQAVTTANGLAARVSTSETKITNIEGVNTAQSTQITGLQTSLTTTNGNVTAAQNAANAANTLAGGKGKVLVQTATPAAADQLVQNLWIDITGGANTPKRWSGTAWVAVTDKVATDAATAAANALALATTKADASAVQSLTTRVTSAEGTISSQGTAITGLNNSLTITNTNVTAAQNAANAANTLAGGKGKVIVQAAAPAAADQLAQNLWIDITGGANTPKRWTGSTWAPVTDKVATDAAAAAASALAVANTKADASTVSGLSNTVTQQGNAITAQGSAITSIKASIGQQLDNLLVRGNFEDGLADPWTTPTGAPPTAAVSTNSASTAFSKAVAFYANSFCGVPFNILTVAGEQFDVTAEVSGDEMSAGQAGNFQMQFYNSENVNLGYITAFAFAATTGAGFKKFSGRITAPANAVSARFVTRIMPVDNVGRALWCNIAARRVTAADAANASATTALTATVTQQGNTLTSQGTAVTALQNRVTDVEGVNTGQTTALNNLDSRVTDVDGKITSLASQTTTLEAVVGGARDGTDEGDLASAISEWKSKAAIQITAKAQADTDGKLSTMWAVKMQVNANGQYVAAGIGLGIEQNAEGLLQSQFLVSADRFAVVNSVAGGALVSPFVVQNGQVFINTALINTAFIQEIILGMTLRSETLDSKGRPLLEINVKAGTLVFRGGDANGSILLDSTGLAAYDGNEKRRGKFGRI